jgi:hypothetical protein
MFPSRRRPTGLAVQCSLIQMPSIQAMSRLACGEQDQGVGHVNATSALDIQIQCSAFLGTGLVMSSPSCPNRLQPRD